MVGAFPFFTVCPWRVVAAGLTWQPPLHTTVWAGMTSNQQDDPTREVKPLQRNVDLHQNDRPDTEKTEAGA